jgi:hypothetical protein
MVIEMYCLELVNEIHGGCRVLECALVVEYLLSVFTVLGSNRSLWDLYLTFAYLLNPY